jgi:polyribonucleotide nucleotidyltransferase
MYSKYKEYIKNGQNLYKITEKTTVTIKINPENRNVYTYINMPDSKYKIAAWIGDIKLSDTNNSYKNLGVIKGVSNFDVIEVEVNGTLYDDQNAVIGN